jgi:hypothetical protein
MGRKTWTGRKSTTYTRARERGEGEGRLMDQPWERAEVRCPHCLEILVLRPGLREIWCQRCENGYDVMESPNPKDPERTVLVLSKKRG